MEWNQPQPSPWTAEKQAGAAKVSGCSSAPGWMPIGLPSNTPPSCVERSLTSLFFGQEGGRSFSANHRLTNQEESNLSSCGRNKQGGSQQIRPMSSISCFRILLCRQPHYLFMRSGHPGQKRRAAKSKSIQGQKKVPYCFHPNFIWTASCCWTAVGGIRSSTPFEVPAPARLLFLNEKTKTVMAFNLGNASLSGWHLSSAAKSIKTQPRARTVGKEAPSAADP